MSLFCYFLINFSFASIGDLFFVAVFLVNNRNQQLKKREKQLVGVGCLV
ncbi:hypothetical protein N475_07890 [Pseudoalteromonas luteoviolacea DSM 6061]|uniref:Uncharacterized protein n=1 Tax=Pseudoalteromonas luteoviolacea DSM 6061 TaxID=1365250 RepID=A0A167AAS1_9GAMM|nr:hypothetical protein N475_07890 [Pseudoalteromonas luteoviolacea DSM 6061]